MDELIRDFLTETTDSLTELDTQIIALEQQPDNRDIIDSIFRVMHTIKGTCGFLNLTRLGSIAHAGEDVLDHIRSGTLAVTPDIISVILEAIDCIKDIVGKMHATGQEPEGDDQVLVGRLHACASGEKPAAPATPAAPAVSETGAEAAADDSSQLQAIFDAAPGPEDSEDWSGEAETLQKELVSKEAKTNDSQDLQAIFDAAPGPQDAEDWSDKIDTLQSQVGGRQNAIAADGKKVPVSSTIADDTKKEAVEKGLMAAQEKSAKPPTIPAAQSIRVHLHLLENLMQMASELVLARNQLLQINRHITDSSFTTPLQRLSHITTDLQESVMKTRMQPISNVWQSFPRIIRDLAQELGKKIDLQMEGKDTELDRQMLEMIKDPLTHMIRNACDHGMDTPEERSAAKKREVGTVTLSAYHEGGHMIVKISDDGRGVHVEKVKNKAIEKKMITASEAANLSDKQIIQFIFKPGFSTAEKITSVSGRGVGMDVVVSNIEKIGGTVEVESVMGKGTSFIIKLPLTLAIMSVLIVEAAGERYAIPQIRVSEVVHATLRGDLGKGQKEECIIEDIHQTPVLRLRGELLPLAPLQDVLQTRKASDSVSETSPRRGRNKHKKNVVVCELGSYQFGMIVDRVFDTEEIVVKPVSPLLRSIPVYSGCTILGDGNVVMILDLNGVLKRMGDTSSLRQKERDESSKAARFRVASDDDMVNFLLFRGGGHAPKAVPVELVSRLEEISVETLEWAGDKHVVQYRGELMRLMTADDTYTLPESGKAQVIVFNDEGKVLGLVVESILDIVEQPMDVRSVSGKDGILGSMVIKGSTYDLVDVGYYFSNVFDDWLAAKTLHQDTQDNEVEVVQQHKRVLLIDDSPFFRKFMKPILTVAHYTVTTADSAVKAMEMLQGGVVFDVIITDIEMPKMSGIEFTRQCKSDPRLAHIPIVALTSYANEDVMQEDDAAAFDGFVSKSDREKLVDTIAEVMSRVLHHTEQKLGVQT